MALKKRAEELTLQFLNQHRYFSQTWNMLDSPQKRVVLDIIVSRKCVITYEKINSTDTLNLKPEYFLQRMSFLVHLRERL